MMPGKPYCVRSSRACLYLGLSPLFRIVDKVLSVGAVSGVMITRGFSDMSLGHFPIVRLPVHLLHFKNGL